MRQHNTLDATRDQMMYDIQAQQLEMMTRIQQIQQHQHDYAGRTKHNMSGLIDEIEEMRVCVKDLQEYIHHVGMPLYQHGRGGHGGARGRGYQ